MRAAYVPILRAKHGEIEALGHLSPIARRLTRPLLDVSWDDKESPEQLQTRLGDILSRLARSWGTTTPVYLDMSRFPPGATVSRDQLASEYLFSCARQLRLQAIPVTGPASDRGPGDTYLDVFAGIVSRSAQGVALRFSYETFANPAGLAGLIDELRTRLHIRPEEIDVILDAESIALLPDAEREHEHLEGRFLDAVRVLESIGGLRGIVIAGSSLPEKYKRTLDGPPIRVTRVELLIWQALQSRARTSLIAFGDYGIAFPRETDPRGPVIVPSRVRISTNTEQLLFKSRRGQYRSLSEHVLRHASLAGIAPSWGLNSIRGCAAGSEGEGNATTWVARDANAHIENTVMFLDSTLSKLGRAVTAGASPSQPWPWLQDFLFDKQ